jgi:hypothetical protein
MVLSFELDDLLPAGVAAGDAQGMHRCFSARVGQADRFYAGAHMDYALGYPGLGFGNGCEDGPMADGFGNAVGDTWVRMPQDNGTEPEAIVDVAITIEIPIVASLSTCHRGGFGWSPVAEIGRHTQWHDLHSAVAEGLGFLIGSRGHCFSSKVFGIRVLASRGLYSSPKADSRSGDGTPSGVHPRIL